MTLAQVQSHILFSPNVSPSDRSTITAIITNIYQNSGTGSEMLDALVNSNRYITFEFTPGMAEGTEIINPQNPPQYSTIFFDMDFINNISMINTSGDVVQNSATRVIAHELTHQIFQHRDMTYSSPDHGGLRIPFGTGPDAPTYDMQSIDLVGNTVRVENAIMQELGENQVKSTYVGTQTNSFFANLGLGSQLTGGNAIDSAILGHALPNGAQNRIFTNDLYQTGDSTRDLVVGLDGSEYVFTGMANDYIYDGGGADILEGGEGNDIITLDADGASDVVLVGLGEDRIRGGDTNDRIAIRGDLFANDPSMASSGWANVAPGLGISGATKAVPLLGGFVYPGGPGDPVVAQYEFDYSVVSWRPVYKPEDPRTYYALDIQHAREPLWDEFVNSTIEEDDFYIDLPFFNISYTMGTGSNGLPELAISVGYWNTMGDFVTNNTYIEDFQQGDFGIRFITPSVVVNENGDSIPYAGSASDVSYINNGGAYLTIPEQPQAFPPNPPPQRFSEPNEIFVFEDMFTRHNIRSQDDFPTDDGPWSANGEYARSLGTGALYVPEIDAHHTELFTSLMVDDFRF